MIGLTGLFLCLFLLEHLGGNLLLLLGDNGLIYNSYADFLAHNPVMRLPEIVLGLGFIYHIVQTLILTLQNRKARPVNYAVSGGSENAGWSSRNMAFLGIIILIFLILHLSNFFVKARIDTTDMTYDVNGNYDLYNLVKTEFSHWWYSLIYVVSMIALGAHLIHGFQSAFRSMGLRHRKYLPLVRVLGNGFAVLVPLGFAVIPVYFYLNSL